MADKKESQPTPGRTITVGKITYPIIRTYYNPLQDAVIDVYEKTRTVETRKGDKEVALQVHIRSRDEALQKKYARDKNTNVEVNIDVE
jgi:hypothetical protein